MKKLLSVALASVILATGVMATGASAEPRRQQQDRVIEKYCGNHRNGNDCNDWRRNRNSWNDDRYNRWYRDHNRDFGDNAAAALFGFVAGAATSAIITGSTVVRGGGHVAACQARYRSYDPRSDTYLGFDGVRKYCRL